MRELYNAEVRQSWEPAVQLTMHPAPGQATTSGEGFAWASEREAYPWVSTEDAIKKLLVPTWVPSKAPIPRSAAVLHDTTVDRAADECNELGALPDLTYPARGCGGQAHSHLLIKSYKDS